ncbi:MAG: ABC transporter permease subunit [Anaerolineaceae bacterium]|nr:ABC transporter permease subunit [Anaerolineaceae bacterium]
MTDGLGRQVPSLTTDAGEPESTLNLDYWQIVWRQFRKHVPAMIGLCMVLSLFLLAVFAPFLANKYPYYWRSDSEGLTFPLFRSLTNLDLTILCAFVLVVLVPVTRCILRRIGWSFWELHEIRRAFAVNVLLFVLAALLLANLRAVPERIFMDREVTIAGRTHVVRIERNYREEIAGGADASYLFPPIHYSPSDILVASKFEMPSRKHILGADRLGRSTAARLIYGTRVSLAVGFISVGLSVLVGVLVGGISAYFGGWTDLILQRVVEIFMCFPRLFLILTIIAMYGPKLWLIMIVIGLTGWTGTARFIRAEILKVKTLDYVTAARALGLRSLYIVIRHALPNSIAPVLVGISFGVAAAIGLEVSLSFLGLGDPDYPSWGLMLKQARAIAGQHPLILIIPGVSIFFAVLAYNLVGEGMRDAIDPRLKM